MSGGMMFVLGFITTATVASQFPRAAVNAFLLTVIVGISVHVIAREVVVSDRVKVMEMEAFRCLKNGDNDGAFEMVKKIQKIDPMNADCQFIGGKIAEIEGFDPTPIMMQGANWGSGFALAWLQEKGKECPCCPAAGGGMALAGKR